MLIRAAAQAGPDKDWFTSSPEPQRNFHGYNPYARRGRLIMVPGAGTSLVGPSLMNPPTDPIVREQQQGESAQSVGRCRAHRAHSARTPGNLRNPPAPQFVVDAAALPALIELPPLRRALLQ